MISTFTDFEKAATNAATISGHLGASFVEVRNHIMDVSRELSRKTIFGINEVATAFYDLASAGYDVSSMTEKDLIPILNYAAATQSDLANAVQAVATALKAFRLDFSEAARVADVFTAAITSSFLTFDKLREAMKYAAPISGELGISIEDLTASIATLVDRGLEGCYDEKTRVLTSEGFKYFRDLNKNEKFLTYSLENDRLEWQSATDYIKFEYHGNMYHVKNRFVDLVVTPNHKMLVSGRFSKKLKLELVTDIFGKSRRYKLSGNWISQDPKFFVLPSDKYQDRNRDLKEIKIDWQTWIKFMALYLAEGDSYSDGKGNYEVRISQSLGGKAYSEIIQVLDDLPFKYSKTRVKRIGSHLITFRIHSKQLYNYLNQFGKSHEKFIPKYIKDSSRQSIELFLKYYELGDGSGGHQFYTSSEKMRDDLLELIIKTDRGASFYLATKPGDSNGCINKRVIKSKHDNWCIEINSKMKTPLFSRKEYTKWHKDRYKKSFGKSIIEAWEKYDGYAYSVTVPNHILVVERNGKVVLSGNSQAGQRLNMVFTKLLKPTDKAKKMLEDLGLTMEDLDPTTHSLVDILYTLQAVNFGASEAATMFRARTAASAAVLVDSADEIARYSTQLKLSGGISEQVATYQEKTLWGAFKMSQNAIAETGSEIAENLVPTLYSAASFIKDSLSPILKTWGERLTAIIQYVQLLFPLI